MHWYEGSIAEAVTLSKQKNAIFVVFVEGEDDLSSEMAATIDDSAVVKRLSNQANFLTIKLKSGSPNYAHFAHLYQLVPVPSLFFIGRNGTPLEVVCAGVQPNNLATRIDRILEEHHKEKQQPTFQSSSAHIQQQTVNLLLAESTHPRASRPVDEPESSSGPAAKIQKTEHHEITKSGKEYDVVCNDDVCVRVPKVKPDDPGPSQREPATVSEAQPVQIQPVQVPVQVTPVQLPPVQIPPVQPVQSAVNPTAPQPPTDVPSEEKLEKAKELIEARRREKAEKEKELERQKELERRNVGQGVAELKRWQADQELKQIQEERKREKKENDMARQRVLEQIAQDRAERRARETKEASPQAQPSHAQPATAGDGSARSRIQFKLPDGTSHTAHFDADGTLADVQRYVADNLQLTASSFSLWTAFPRRELTETEATLRRLELTPSAALLVLPRRAPTTVASPSAFSAIITLFTQFFTTFILDPSQQLFTWLRNRLFPPGAPTTRGSSPQPGGGTVAGGVRRRTNVHRLTGEKADDDNNTWNGNSTQQM